MSAIALDTQICLECCHVCNSFFTAMVNGFKGASVYRERRGEQGTVCRKNRGNDCDWFDLFCTAMCRWFWSWTLVWFLSMLTSMESVSQWDTFHSRTVWMQCGQLFWFLQWLNWSASGIRTHLKTLSTTRVVWLISMNSAFYFFLNDRALFYSGLFPLTNICVECYRNCAIHLPAVLF